MSNIPDAFKFAPVVDMGPFKPHIATDAVAQLLDAIGQDATRAGLVETPNRVVKFLLEFCTPEPFKFTTFDAEGVDEMIVQAGIPFYSLCEHHMLPFFGTACVGYIPNGRIVGLSKLARCVQFHAAGLQNQERITRAVATQLMEALEFKREEQTLGSMLHDDRPPMMINVVDSAHAIGVVLRARHMCMEMRGVKAHNTWSTTSCLLGSFRTDEKQRAEFLALARNGA